MFLAFTAFLVAATIVLAAYSAVTYLPGEIARRKLDRRLREVSAPMSPLALPGEDTVLKRQAKGPLPSVDKYIAQASAFSSLSKLIEQSGVRTTSSGICVWCAGSAVLLALIGWMSLHYWLAPILAGALGAVTPILWLMRRRTVRLKRFEEHFPEALDLLSRAIRAGHAFQTAMGMVADELPAPVGPEFRKTFDQQNFGLPLRDALNELSERVSLLDVRFFVTAVLIQRETGGNLSEILENLAHVVRERFKIQRQVRVHTAHGRFTGWVLMALPAALAVALTYLNPDLMQLLFHERMGQQMLMVAIVLQTIGFFWIRHVIKIEV